MGGSFFSAGRWSAVGLSVAMGATLAFAGPPRAVADESIADRTVTATAVGCARPLLAATRTAAFVASHNPTALETAAQRSGLSVERLTSMAEDRDVRINRCGRAFYVDRELMASPAQAQAAQAATSTTALRPLSETFNLESKPGSSRTIYLDFRGGTINGTAWNVDYGANLVAEPYSKDGAADTSFSNAELTEIQKAWQAVAEDYAPFNVNVTTRDLGAAAIDRADANDQVFGTRVLVTNGGTIYNDCTCGGVAYLNVYTISGADHGYYQPAWVFSNGTTKAGKYMAEAITHEVGHNFGLSHDGTQTADYSSGTSPWGPIMGAPYNMPVTQWSKGEYPGANNQQDDLAIIAGGAPLRADDHGNTAAAATAFTASTGASGVISTRADVDAFKFTGSGSTTVTLKGADGMPDLDAQLTILDQNGATVATVNPAVQYVSAYEASGLGATWTGNLPAGGATYTVLVDGVGSGAPSVAGRYSDYGSLGNYTVDVTTGAGSGTNTVTVTNPGTQSGTVGTAKSLQIQASDSAAGQTLTYSATGLPTGLTFNAGTGLISGTPTTAGSTSVTVTVRDTTNASGSTTFTWNIAAAPTTTCSGNRVSNGGFESGATGWTATSGVIGSFTDQPARTGTKAAWLDGYGSSHTDKVSRNVSIPAGCKAKLSFWLHIDTAENNAADPTAYDQLTIRAGTTVLGTFSNLNAANGYVLRQYDVSAFAGQTVTISFTGVEDSSLQTSFVLDDVSVTLS